MSKGDVMFLFRDQNVRTVVGFSMTGMFITATLLLTIGGGFPSGLFG